MFAGLEGSGGRSIATSCRVANIEWCTSENGKRRLYTAGKYWIDEARQEYNPTEPTTSDSGSTERGLLMRRRRPGP